MAAHSEPTAPRSPAVSWGSRGVTEAFYRAAAMAGYAPSMHNQQPWRWGLGSDVLDLHMERARLNGVIDKRDRLALMSCGAALHHARVGLAAYGWSAIVEFRPGNTADHLARLYIDGIIPTDLAAVRLAKLMRLRQTDHQPVSGAPPAREDMAAISAAVSEQHVSLHNLRSEHLHRLAGGHLSEAEPTAAQWNHELADWNSVPHDLAASFAVLHGTGDLVPDWLRAGAALAAGWLVATGRGVSVLPLSAPALNAQVSASIRAFLTDLGRPYLVLRLVRHAGDATRQITPRLPERQLIEHGS